MTHVRLLQHRDAQGVLAPRVCATGTALLRDTAKHASLLAIVVERVEQRALLFNIAIAAVGARAVLGAARPDEPAGRAL